MIVLALEFYLVSFVLGLVVASMMHGICGILGINNLSINTHKLNCDSMIPMTGSKHKFWRGLVVA